jgi:transglutaminase-like putative cysteine protease
MLLGAGLITSHAIAESAGATLLLGIFGGLLMSLAGGMIGYLLRRYAATFLKDGVILTTLFLLPVAVDQVVRMAAHVGVGTEQCLIVGLNLASWWLIWQSTDLNRRIVMLTSLGTGVIAASLCQHIVSYLYVVWLITAIIWGLTSEARGTKAQRNALASILVAVVSGIFIVAAAATGRLSPHALTGFLPGSGGSQLSDPFGRGGVGNGEGEVAATTKTEDIGFANTDITVESDKRTLYDAMSEMYGKPEPLTKVAPKHRKVVFWAKEMIEKPKTEMVSPNASKGFSTRRGQGKAANSVSNTAAKALVYVSGRTPVYLPLTAFDSYIDEEWEPGRTHSESEVMEHKGNSWMQFRLAQWPNVFGSEEHHQIKIGILATSTLPLPQQLVSVRIDQLKEPDFYRWTQRGILCLDQVPIVPSGIRIDTVTRTFDLDKLNGHRLTTLTPDNRRHVHYRVPKGMDPRIAALAKEWTVGVPTGWPQVQAVVNRLRSYARHDRLQSVPPDEADALTWFLFKSKSGPDYLFATAATLMIRSLGYPARVVNGIYVDGKHKDARTGHSIASLESLHFWCQVETEAAPDQESLWVNLEPTPGYFLPSPKPTFRDMARDVMLHSFSTFKANKVLVGLMGMLIITAFALRMYLLDAFFTLRWLLRCIRRPDRMHVETMRLLDARARIAGRPRKAATSHAKHYIRSPHAVFAANLKLGIRDYERITYGLESDVSTVNLQTVAWRWNAQRLRGYLPK